MLRFPLLHSLILLHLIAFIYLYCPVWLNWFTVAHVLLRQLKYNDCKLHFPRTVTNSSPKPSQARHNMCQHNDENVAQATKAVLGHTLFNDLEVDWNILFFHIPFCMYRNTFCWTNSEWTLESMGLAWSESECEHLKQWIGTANEIDWHRIESAELDCGESWRGEMRREETMHMEWDWVEEELESVIEV